MWCRGVVDPSRLVTPELIKVARRQGGVVHTAQCDAHDVIASRRRRLIAGGVWSRVARGAFDTGVRDKRLHPFDQERWRRAWLVMCAYPRGIAIGEVALQFHGAQGLPRDLAMEVGLPGGRSALSRAGVTVRQVDLTGRTRVIRGREVAEPVVALVQAMRTLTRIAWVCCADSMLHQGVVDVADLDRIRRLARRAGPSAKPAWVGLLDGRAESPLESQARLQCVDAGIPPDAVQHEFRDEQGHLLARVDLAWRLGGGRWLVVEIDGNAYHSSDDQLGYDTRRQNELLRDGRIILLRFRREQIAHSPGIAPEVESILRREGWTPSPSAPTP